MNWQLFHCRWSVENGLLCHLSVWRNGQQHQAGTVLNIYSASDWGYSNKNGREKRNCRKYVCELVENVKWATDKVRGWKMKRVERSAVIRFKCECSSAICMQDVIVNICHLNKCVNVQSSSNIINYIVCQPLSPESSGLHVIGTVLSNFD